ncbi:hypothetical protein RF11_05145 [Thelohanellus kitauei]|uniref:Uncharacterized protein n=1 Tax=Thelohanellus kitauei TaxID=669202 RepID=A0A0C2IPG5_THEKT|nr:hypothetical protein RF11_05145 [Thelohanellus kitauei]
MRRKLQKSGFRSSCCNSSFYIVSTTTFQAIIRGEPSMTRLTVCFQPTPNLSRLSTKHLYTSPAVVVFFIGTNHKNLFRFVDIFINSANENDILCDVSYICTLIN